MPIKITRTMFVGLGGTGVKAILRTKQCFMDAYGEIPPMVGFLAIDTDKKIRDQKLDSRKGGDVKLAENEICFCPINGSAVEILNGNPSDFTWFPKRNTTFLRNLKNEGAGAVRTNGRFLARYNAKIISDKISSVVAEIGAPLPIDCKFEYDIDSNGMQFPTIINIVGSVAGGTGAGLIIDIINLASEAMKNSGLAYRIFPWFVLPEIFRHMAPGVATQNVFANAYGVLTEMDYLYHMSVTNQNPINFGFAQITSLDGAIGRTALFNNKNKAGIVFQNIEEVTDAIGRCMFLPSNGVDGISVEDNLSAASFAYNVGNKEAHYSSAGSSELVYDNYAVGEVIARAIISDLCQSLTEKENITTSLQEAVNWASSEAVGIEEHNVNYLTDYLLPLQWPGSISFDRNSDGAYIRQLIEAASTAEYVVEEVKRNFGQKEISVNNLLKQEIEEKLKNRNGVGSALSFLEGLITDVQRSKSEMENELCDLKTKIQIQEQTDWDVACRNIRRPLYLGGGIDQDEADTLRQQIDMCICSKRDELRHRYAIQFYKDLETEISKHKTVLSQLKLELNNIATRQAANILDIQKKAKNESNFQIYLHALDVEEYRKPGIEDIFIAFSLSNSVSNLIGLDENVIEELLKNFAKNQDCVKNAVNVTIEDKLQNLMNSNPQKVTALIDRLKHMASPMWNTNLGKYSTKASPLSGIFVVGCYDAINGILQANYKSQFKFGSQDASFVSTRQKDRIMLYRIECYSPLYAVNNFAGYKREAEDAIRREAYPVPYIDEHWYQRMKSENFDVYPRTLGDTIFPNWVNAIVYGYIKYNVDEKTYYIMSQKGDKLRGGYLALGARRDVAFDAFQNMALDKEVEQRLQDETIQKGRPQVDAVMQAVKEDRLNYVTEYAQLSPIELDMVNRRDSAYQMVIDQLVKEVEYIESL